jgi:mono/diheme cytochrome c family protein
MQYTIDPIPFSHVHENNEDSGGNTLKSFFAGVLIVLGCIIVGGGAFVLSGDYNVAADVPHWKVTLLLLEAVKDRSIAAHSKGITVPSLNEEGLIQVGFPHFQETCRLCHGAPGYPREEFAEGLYPNPPFLGSHELQRELGDRELYWIVKNGLKMTGMPAFGKTHSEEQLWGIVAFLRRLPSLDSRSYEQMVEARSEGSARGTEQNEQ